MGKLSLVAHYRNKYPGGQVFASDSVLDVYCKEGLHRVHLEKDAFGHWVDRSVEWGCVDQHSLAPIPKDTRAWKVYPDGKLGKAEEYAERSVVAAELCEKHGGKIPSEKELQEAAKK